jgi:Putative Actinobacterial Holin-X, holin superfamily III
MRSKKQQPCRRPAAGTNAASSYAMERYEEHSGVANLGQTPRPALENQPLGDLVSQLSRDATLLAQQEIALAKQEAADKLGLVKAEIVGLAVGAVLLHSGVLTLLAGIVLALAQVLPAWVAALVAGAALLAVGAGFLLKAKARLARLDLAPKQAVGSVKRDVRAVKEAAE